MATLQQIENHLNIEIGDKKFRNGRKYPNKNRYYRFDDFYVVSLTQGKFMIIDPPTAYLSYRLPRTPNTPLGDCSRTWDSPEVRLQSPMVGNGWTQLNNE